MFDIKSMATKFLSSPEGQKMIIEFLTSSEGQAQLKQFIGSPEGKGLVIQFVNQTIGMLNLDENTQKMITTALNTVA